MNVRIIELETEHEELYQQFVLSVSESLLYHSLAYSHFLQSILENAEKKYLLAFKNAELVGALPVFIKNGKFGTVVNSLPFFGSNGSLILKDHEDQSVINSLFQAFDDLCREVDAVASTIIQNPVARNRALFSEYKADFIDQRTGQITFLPEFISENETGKQLLKSMHVKTRNAVRKGEKSGFIIYHNNSLLGMKALFSLHKSNMQKISGTYKPWLIFENIRSNFDYDLDYRVYFAEKDGNIAAALLVFYFNNTVEYFTPVIDDKYRSEQPLSYLIFNVMKDAVKRNYSRWNWGGTWSSQDGVYRFKSRWAAQDFKYRYYTRLYANKNRILDQNERTILTEYPYFFTIPFSELNVNKQVG